MGSKIVSGDRRDVNVDKRPDSLRGDDPQDFVEAPAIRNRASRGAIIGALLGVCLWIAILVALGVIKL